MRHLLHVLVTHLIGGGLAAATNYESILELFFFTLLLRGENENEDLYNRQIGKYYTTRKIQQQQQWRVVPKFKAAQSACFLLLPSLLHAGLLHICLGF